MPAMGPIGSVVNAPRNGDPRSRSRSRVKVLAQMPGESSFDYDTPGRWENFDGFTSDTQAPRSERDQLNELRKASAAAAKERDALKRSVREALHEGAQ
jgi:hypothetical protein